MFDYLVDIKDRLITDEIDYIQAHDLLEGENSYKKPWHTKEWKLKRLHFIQDSCVQCGASGVMVLQHLWHHNTFYYVLNLLAVAEIEEQKIKYPLLLDEYLKSNVEFNNIEKTSRDCCPYCGSTNVYFRKTLNDFKCSNLKCRREFSSVESVYEYLPESKKQIAAIKFDFRNDFIAKSNAVILSLYGKEAILLCIEEFQRYLSFSDTVTMCKKCAFMMDMQGKVLSEEGKWVSGKYIKPADTKGATP